MAVGENSFDEVIAGAVGDANIQHTKNYKPIQSENVYEFLSNSYHGTGGYRNGRYLVPHSREMFYKTRQSLSYYRNFTKPITRAMYQPVFADQVPRQVSPNSSIFGRFLKNVDNRGTGMQEYMESATRLSRLHGVTFIVMENFPADVMPQTLGAAQEARVFPYVYTQQAVSVEDFEADRFGNIEWIAFYDSIRKVGGKEERIYRLWNREYSVLVRKRANTDKSAVGLSKFEEVSPPVIHGLGTVPVIPVYTNIPDDATNILPDPPLYDIARINWAIYNKDSEIRDLERAQGFSLLVVQDDSGGELTVGSTNIIFVPTTASNMPQYISPDSNILKGLVENSEKLREDLFRIAEQLGVYGTAKESSGVALGYRFFAHESVLKYTAVVASSTEDKIAELFRLYTGTDFSYETEYPQEFQAIDLGGEADSLDKYLMQDLTPEARTLALQKYTRLILGDQEPDRVSKAVESFEAREEELTQAEAVSRDEEVAEEE